MISRKGQTDKYNTLAIQSIRNTLTHGTGGGGGGG